MFYNWTIETVVLRVAGLLIAITVHEVAHGYTAFLLGDRTAYMRGRLTLNPVSHLDPLGALMLFLVGFGWAKPVPVSPYNFRDPRRGMLLVSVAGPASNIALAALIAIPIRAGLFPLAALGHMLNVWILNLMLITIMLNLALAVFNLLPVPPLDGSKILAGLVPTYYHQKLAFLDTYGHLILILLLLTGLHRYIIVPVLNLLLFLVLGR